MNSIKNNCQNPDAYKTVQNQSEALVGRTRDKLLSSRHGVSKESQEKILFLADFIVPHQTEWHLMQHFKSLFLEELHIVFIHFFCCLWSQYYINTSDLILLLQDCGSLQHQLVQMEKCKRYKQNPLLKKSYSLYHRYKE